MAPSPEATCSASFGCPGDSCQTNTDCYGEYVCLGNTCSSAIKRSNLVIIGSVTFAVIILLIIGCITTWCCCIQRSRKRAAALQSQHYASRDMNTSRGIDEYHPQSSHGGQSLYTNSPMATTASPMLSTASPISPIPNSSVPMTPAPSYTFAVSNPVAELPAIQTTNIELEAISRPTTAGTKNEKPEDTESGEMLESGDEERLLKNVVTIKQREVKNG